MMNIGERGITVIIIIFCRGIIKTIIVSNLGECENKCVYFVCVFTNFLNFTVDSAESAKT